MGGREDPSPGASGPLAATGGHRRDGRVPGLAARCEHHRPNDQRGRRLCDAMSDPGTEIASPDDLVPSRPERYDLPSRRLPVSDKPQTLHYSELPPAEPGSMIAREWDMYRR